MAVAAESFLDSGYAGTTMSGIAATLGGSKGTLWSYFSSKEELFASVIERATADYRALLSEILEAPCDDLALTLKRVCASILEKVTGPQSIALHRLVVAEAGRFPEMGVIFYDRGPRMTHTLLAKFLADEMARGRIRNDDPLQTARILASMCVYRTQQQLLWGVIDHTTPEAMEADVDRAVDLFMRAYAL
ncbi:MAG TPA: TetR/AcrR family transcriptional regulator C-terminal domain-containing protein [Sphingobium sp.]